MIVTLCGQQGGHTQQGGHMCQVLPHIHARVDCCCRHNLSTGPVAGLGKASTAVQTATQHSEHAAEVQHLTTRFKVSLYSVQRTKASLKASLVAQQMQMQAAVMMGSCAAAMAANAQRVQLM